MWQPLRSFDEFRVMSRSRADELLEGLPEQPPPFSSEAAAQKHFEHPVTPADPNRSPVIEYAARMLAARACMQQRAAGERDALKGARAMLSARSPFDWVAEQFRPSDVVERLLICAAGEAPPGRLADQVSELAAIQPTGIVDPGRDLEVGKHAATVALTDWAVSVLEVAQSGLSWHYVQAGAGSLGPKRDLLAEMLPDLRVARRGIDAATEAIIAVGDEAQALWRPGAAPAVANRVGELGGTALARVADVTRQTPFELALHVLYLVTFNEPRPASRF